MPKAALLLYDPAPSPWASKVRQLCAIQGLRFSAVDTAQLDRPIRDLAFPTPAAPGSRCPSRCFFSATSPPPNWTRSFRAFGTPACPGPA